MVYAFILHTLLPGSCKVLFHQLYGIDGVDINDEDNDTEVRTMRKKRVEYVASQVK